ncbi:NAD-dependent epimerase/dehydratase family protein [Leptolyngbya cf. ectocarpi LEGE 11479]|uniref:NAD-dependent epimerase/dehydratase family protein n=1 Tax=Leptolyngbya cf. ectocarpi LEGE 11479 TaxID=1828722 RepID=A0A928ZX64_LEPEC|nr:NAD-dependent epimerase/dehydratase family protein [Leptolyngbya ectocarpi]MBE9069087.1 NAD-dependent epimerase/dehydratase family protein [Leptolyngbya cf. ectocarpi LEGE 11479]
MKAFVTGSTGLLGSNLTRLLLDQGFEVIALTRELTKASKLLGEHPSLKVIQGDLQEVGDFAHYLKGCDVLFHTASYFRESFDYGNHWEQLKAINVDATIHLLEAAEKAGISKVIYTSSACGCVGIIRGGAPSNESTPFQEFNYKNPYFKSKLMAEEAISNFLKSHDLPVVLILPAGMLGPNDAAPTELGRFILNFLKGNAPLVPSGGFPIVDARDVAMAMLSAVYSGQPNERYLVTGGYYSVSEIMHNLSEVSGQPIPSKKLPRFAVRLWALFQNLLGRLQGKKPFLHSHMVRIMLSRQWFDASKASQGLKTTYRPFKDTIKDTVQWYQQNGYMRQDS